MKLQELFEADQKKRLDEVKKNQWDIKVNESSRYVNLVGNISLSSDGASFYEYYVNVTDKLKEMNLSKEEYKQAHEEIRDALDEAEKEVQQISIEDEVQKISETMYGLMRSVIAEADQKKEEVFERHVNETFNEIKKRYGNDS